MNHDASPLEAVVARLEPHTPPAAWAIAACGLPPAQINDLAELLVAQSHEASVFLDLMPLTIRNLASTTTMETERCVGYIRGPILWSETVTAWSSGPGANDVFVCMAPRRDYDLAENRAVAWLLRRLARSVVRLDTAASMLLDDATQSVIRANALEAKRWGRHRFLRGVPTNRPSRVDLRKLRTTRHHGVYRSVQSFAARLAMPLVADELADAIDPVTDAQLCALNWLWEELEASGRPAGDWSVSAASLRAEALTYRHPAHFGPSDRGIWLGDLVLDVSPSLVAGQAATVNEMARATNELSARAAGQPWLLIGDRDDARLAVQLAIDSGAMAALP